MSNKKIDILMATYNGEKYIVEQINSIINQTYINWNLLIRDDGSSDKTLEILKSFEKKDSRIKIIKDNKKNLGVVKNFEELLYYSSAEYIMFSDQDDIWNENKIKIYIEEMNKNFKNQECMIHSNAILYKIGKKNQNKLFIPQKFVEKKIENMFFNYFVQGSTIMMTKGIKDFIIPFPEEVHLHDRYIHIMTELFFERVFINEPLIYYRQHENNQIGGKNSIKKILFKKYFNQKDRELIKIIYQKYKKELIKEKKDIIENYFFLTDRKNSRLKRLLRLKKTKIFMPIKKQLFLLLKG